MKRYLISLILIVFLVASSFGVQAADYTKYGIEADVPGACSFEAIDAKDYSGRTLNIITHAVPVMGEPTALHAKQFEELTGAKTMAEICREHQVSAPVFSRWKAEFLKRAPEIFATEPSRGDEQQHHAGGHGDLPGGGQHLDADGGGAPGQRREPVFTDRRHHHAGKPDNYP